MIGWNLIVQRNEGAALTGGWRKVAVVGGGPAGLFLARLIRMARPAVSVDVYERNAPDEASGFGVVFSARTMSELRRNDPETHARIVAASVAVSDMELRHPRATLRYGGFDFSSISRRALLLILREQAAKAGATLHFGKLVAPGSLDDADVVVYADGANSSHRDVDPERFGTSVRHGSSPYMWLGTHAPFDAATFAFVETEHGHFAGHAYPYADGMTTVVVETDPGTWKASGMDRAGDFSRNPGGSDEEALAQLGEIFAEHLGGHPLIGNRSRWSTFRTVHNERWSEGNAVLLGDAAHTAHFTVGSGTKMAMEDAISLAAALQRNTDPGPAFAEYERERRGPVARTQEWAEPSMRWWETFGRRLHMAPAQFGLHFMTRTSALSYEGLRRRFPDRVDEAEAAYRTSGGAAGAAPAAAAVDLRPNAVTEPLLLGSVRLRNRLVEVLPEDCGDREAAVRAAEARGAALVLARQRPGLSLGLPVPPHPEPAAR
ncbi:FAD-dependent monooxygenase [Streptomyces sp. NPDC101160]|uniref:FAD-dependent monooxygenase n=1 Tax=Streptomyces sp. NPDC101160 TaxID=3366118 RepID=UPI0037F88238